MSYPTIPLCIPDISEADVQAVASALRDGWLSSVAPQVASFEQAFEASLHTMGAPTSYRALATQSGTSAYWMALHALGLQQGDHVLCPVTSFIATLNPLLYNGLSPVFVDIDSLTLAPTLDAFKAARTPDTKAVVVAHLYGMAMPEIKQLRDWCDDEGLILIEDASESLGTLVNGQPVGSFGHIGFFSFNINKTLTAASGGMLFSENDEMLDKIKHQSTQSKCYGDGELFHDQLGFNLRMNALHAALGESQLTRLPEFLQKKQTIAKNYFDRVGAGLPLAGEGGVPPRKPVFHHADHLHYKSALSTITPSYWLNTLFLTDHAERRHVQQILNDQNIQARPVFMPFVEFPFVQTVIDPMIIEQRRKRFPIAYDVWARGLNLPSSPTLSDDEQSRVIQAIHTALSGV